MRDLEPKFLDALRGFRQRSERAANRMADLQEYIVAELVARGIEEVQTEVSVQAAYRTKNWDVAALDGHRPRLAVTTKSIMKNHSGTVPNRIDDMLGECVAVHRIFPHAVLGYFILMPRRDERKEVGSAPAEHWFARLVASVTRAGGRGSPDDLPERFEAVVCLEIDFDTEPYVLTRCFVYPAERDNADYHEFFNVLAREYRERYS